MKKFIAGGVIGFFLFTQFIYAATTGNRIDMGVSPIVDEFRMERGQTLTRNVKFLNNSDAAYTVYVSIEDCVPGTNYGTPKCAPYTGSGVDIEKASTWIVPSVTGNFTVPARGSRTVPYTVTAPSSASPGGHYGAIFFNNPDQSGTNGNSVSMVRRIGMLFMITVGGNIVVDTQLGEILIETPPTVGNGGGVSATTSIGSGITLWNNPKTYIQQKLQRFMMVFIEPEERANFFKNINPFWSEPKLAQKKFDFEMKIPIKNDGNTHIRPTGKIELYEQDGQKLEKVGKISVVDENGVYLGEKIVDYLPINDEGGNVLPGTERIFPVHWNGFAYNTTDIRGQSLIDFETPGSYYSKKEKEDTQFLYPWEKMAIKNEQRPLLAKVELGYRNPETGRDEVKNVELPVLMGFSYIDKTLNWSALMLLMIMVLPTWWFFRKNKLKKQKSGKNIRETDEIRALEEARSLMRNNPKIKKKSQDKKSLPPVKKTRAKKEEMIPDTGKSTEEKKPKSLKKPQSKKPTKAPAPKKKTPSKE